MPSINGWGIKGYRLFILIFLNSSLPKLHVKFMPKDLKGILRLLLIVKFGPVSIIS